MRLPASASDAWSEATSCADLALGSKVAEAPSVASLEHEAAAS
jgi:hypothetical protein